jgi:hypothetical protein
VACDWQVVDRGDGITRCAGCDRPEERCDAGGTWACLAGSADDDERTGAR